MESNILEIKEPKRYKKYLKNRRSIKRRILTDLTVIIIISGFWVLYLFILNLNPKSHAVSFNKMLPIASGAGILFNFIFKLADFLFYDTVKFKDKYLFYFSHGVGKKIKYEQITDFSFLNPSEDNRSFRFVIFGVKEKKTMLKYKIELSDDITEEQVIRAFREKGVNPQK
jgi:hypothetical protein